VKVTSVLSNLHSPTNLKADSTTRDKSASKTVTTNVAPFRLDLQNQFVALCLKIISKQQLEKASKNFIIKDQYFLTRTMNQIVFNESTRIVAVFKECLIFDDLCEFLQQRYNIIESRRLLKCYVSGVTEL